MASVSQTYAGTFLNASELVPLGQRRTAVVHAAVQEVIGQENKPAIVLDLVAANGRAWPKRVVLNKGNALQLAAAYGDDTDHWVGRQITVWSENVMFQGRLVPGIKVLQPYGRWNVSVEAAIHAEECQLAAVLANRSDHIEVLDR